MLDIALITTWKAAWTAAAAAALTFVSYVVCKGSFPRRNMDSVRRLGFVSS
jgi:hypothetical protein